jgi:hypothetical protein
MGEFEIPKERRERLQHLCSICKKPFVYAPEKDLVVRMPPRGIVHKRCLEVVE